MDILLADSAIHAQDWIVEETDVELGASSKDDDLMRELDESGSESDDEEEIDVKFDSDDE